MGQVLRAAIYLLPSRGSVMTIMLQESTSVMPNWILAYCAVGRGRL